MPDSTSLAKKWVALTNPTEEALASTSKSPSIHASNSALTMISKFLSPFAMTRSLSSTVCLVVIGMIALLFSVLVLMVFRFDLVGGDKGADNIGDAEEKKEKTVLIAENVSKKKSNPKNVADMMMKDVLGKDTKKQKNRPIKFKDESNYNLKFKSPKQGKQFLKNLVINFYPFFLMNYEIFFFIASLIGLGSLNCRYVWVEGGLEKGNSGGNFLQDNGFENALFEGWVSESKEQWVRESVSYLND